MKGAVRRGKHAQSLDGRHPRQLRKKRRDLCAVLREGRTTRLTRAVGAHAHQLVTIRTGLDGTDPVLCFDSEQAERRNGEMVYLSGRKRGARGVMKVHRPIVQVEVVAA